MNELEVVRAANTKLRETVNTQAQRIRELEATVNAQAVRLTVQAATLQGLDIMSNIMSELFVEEPVTV